MKSIVKITAAVLIIIAALFSLIACEEPEITGETGDEQTVTFVLMHGDDVLFKKEYTTKGKYLSYLVKEVNRDEKKISFDLEESAAGAFINSFTYDGKVYGDRDAGYYVMVHSSIMDPRYTDFVFVPPVEYGNAYLFPTAVGISEVPVLDGETYILRAPKAE